MVFIDFHRERGVHSHITAGMARKNSCLFSDVRTRV